ncbi:MAG: hypothetical protein ABI415_04960 [Flavitalea sp.]
MYNAAVKNIKERIAFYSRHNILLYREIGKIKEADILKPEELADIKERQALKLIQYAATNSKFYKKLYSGINLNGSFEEVYPKLPVIHKSDVKKNELQLLTTPTTFLKKGHTSGTSGSPLTVYRSTSLILKENAYVWFYRMYYGLNPGDPIVSMRGVLDNKTLSYYNKAENTLYLSSYLLSKPNIKKYANLLKEFKPKGIFAFPSSVFTLVNLLREEGEDITLPLIFTSSETLYPFQREGIENGLHGKLHDWYGNAERTLALGQCEEGNYHEMPLYSINEFSEKGVVTTSLLNKAFPLIKYYVDDVFRMKDGVCACGRANPVSSLEGRVDDVVLLEDGTKVGRLGVAFQGINHLTYAQIIQENAAAITVNLVTSDNFGAADQQLLESKLRNRLNNGLLINFKRIEEKDIIKTKAGKYKLVVSKIPVNTTIPVNGAV